jgi:hypothetical protein
MGFLQEAAIIAGDLVTQPIKAKVIEIKTGKKQKITKNIVQGALMSDGSINPNIKTSMDAMIEAINTRQVVSVQAFNVKDVSWTIEDQK